ncbi:MAG: methyltransferase domain-containing protein [Ignisphaera sp.]
MYGSIDSPWVPTPKEVVDYVMDIASVSYGDIVYDLGCGDGRIVIEAARRGANAVCVEIDTKLIEIAKRNAVEMGVSDRIEFVNDDIINVDLSRASVIYLYLTSKSIERIKHKMLSEVKPGTIIIALDYGIEHLNSAAILAIDVNNKTYKVYVYIV